MLASPPRKMPVLILDEPFSAPWAAPPFLHLLLCSFAEFSQCNQRQVRWSPGSSVLHMSPGSTHCPHKVLSPANCLLWETQEKARVWGLYLLTKHKHHRKSKPKQQGHCSVFFLPMSNWEVMPIPGISGKEVKGVSTFFCRELGLMQLKRKTKTPASFSAAELPDTPWCCLICSGRAE